MKKHIGVTIGIIIAAVFLTGASKPSLDGRALVASPGELPPGLYVKAAAFLPGDTVLITNPGAKVSIEALVFGTFSPSEGVAVILSPEAADVLLIAKGSNSIVQLTKSGGDTEHSVLAKAFDKASSTVPSEQPADDSVPYEDYVKSEIPAKTEILPPEAQDTQTAEPSVRLGQQTDVPENIPEAVAPEKRNITSEPEHLAQVESAAEPVSEIEESSSSEENLEEEQVFTPFADIADSQMPETEVPAEIPAESAVSSVPPENEEDSPYIAVSESVYDEPVVETAELSALEPETPVEEQSPEQEQPLYAETENPEKEEVQSEAEPDILIAADDNPPVFEQSIESVDVSAGEKNDLPDYFTSSQDDEPSFTEKPLYTDIYFDTDSHLIDSLGTFGKGSYCIQLATYKNRAYIAEVFEKYGDKYPVRLLKSEKIPDAYQVLIGPLNKDEYPVILKRFVSRGFKDAFVRSVR